MENWYRKIENRYVADVPFSGFPADGIWLVRKNRGSMVLTVYLDDLHNLDLRKVIQLSKSYEKIVDVLIEGRDVSASELAREIIKALSSMELSQ